MLITRRSFIRSAATATVLAGAGAWTLSRARASQLDPTFDVLDFDWHDGPRARPVPVRLYLPHGASDAQPVPLVVFSHGIGGSRYGYSYLGTHWAGRGIASLHLQHTGSDRSVWTGGNPFAVVSRLHDAARESEAINRALDLRFALDRILASDLAARLDAARIVAAGHSYGANTTLLAAGARVERAGRPLSLHEPRVRAAIVISAPPFYGEASPRPILAPVQVPTLHVTSTDDVIQIPGYLSGAEDRLAIFDAVGSASKMLAVYTGGSHSMFTDRTASGGLRLNAQVKAATQALTFGFIRSVFDADDHELRDWPTRHADILARFEALRLDRTRAS